MDIIERPETRFARWKATIFYRTETGLCDVEHDIDELFELHDLVERGPHWDTIDLIEIRMPSPSFEDLTVERAEGI